MTDGPSQSRRLEIASSFEELEMIVDEAEAFYKTCFTDDERVFTGVLLATEAVTNAIEHGNDSDASKMVRIEMLKSGKRAEFWVEDEGEGFDRNEIADPLSSEHLLDDGGRGIFLIERLADEVIYAKGGTRIGILLNL